MKRCPATFGGAAALFLALFAISLAHADEVSGDAPKTEVTQQTPAKKTKLKPKGKVTREKETEGTEAPDRFEADTVIKSQYQLDGKQLEVDPD